MGGGADLGISPEVWFFYPATNEWKRKLFQGQQPRACHRRNHVWHLLIESIQHQDSRTQWPFSRIITLPRPVNCTLSVVSRVRARSANAFGSCCIAYNNFIGEHGVRCFVQFQQGRRRRVGLHAPQLHQSASGNQKEQGSKCLEYADLGACAHHAQRVHSLTSCGSVLPSGVGVKTTRTSPMSSSTSTCRLFSLLI